MGYADLMKGMYDRRCSFLILRLKIQKLQQSARYKFYVLFITSCGVAALHFDFPA